MELRRFYEIYLDGVVDQKFDLQKFYVWMNANEFRQKMKKEIFRDEHLQYNSTFIIELRKFQRGESIDYDELAMRRMRRTRGN